MKRGILDAVITRCEGSVRGPPQSTTGESKGGASDSPMELRDEEWDGSLLEAN
jgi:hypothetical protein